MAVVPDAPLDARWYALRHIGLPAEGTTLVGVSIADGGVVGRFFGVPVPELYEIVAQEDGRVTLSFTHNVVPDAEQAASDVARVAQGSIVCETVFLGEPGLLGHRITLECDPVLDWSVAVEIDVVGLMSEQGLPLPPVHLTHTFGEVDTDGYAVLNPESSLVPPPVPAALCAGVDCE
jgi:hypothetical protein